MRWARTINLLRLLWSHDPARFLTRAVVSGTLIGLVWWQVSSHHHEWQTYSAAAWGLAWSAHAGWLIAAISLLLLNVGLEVLKWHLACRPWMRLSATASLRAVLMGHLLGFVTPARLGEYAGRLWEVPTNLRVNGLAALLQSRLSQLTAALVWAAVLLAVFDFQLPDGLRLGGLSLLVMAALCVVTLQLRGADTIRRILPLGRRFGLFRSWLKKWFPAQAAPYRIVIWQLEALAFLRHGVFLAQLVLFSAALWPGDVSVPWATLWLAGGLTFVIKSAVPSVALAELGVREAVAVAVAGWLGLPLLPIVHATLALFLVNLVLPTLVALPMGVHALQSLRSSDDAEVPESIVDSAVC